jgi:predicted ATPase
MMPSSTLRWMRQKTAHIIDERGRNAYQFTHVLFREILYADLPARRRSRLHGRVAEALERSHAADLDAHVSELVYHFGEAQMQESDNKLARHALIAGERAVASRAYEEAVAYFQHGVDARAGQTVDDELAALLFGLGKAQTATLELQRAPEVVANLTRAFDYYAEHGNVQRAVAAAECPVDSLPG